MPVIARNEVTKQSSLRFRHPRRRSFALPSSLFKHPPCRTEDWIASLRSQ
jgi:hypothetical protein